MPGFIAVCATRCEHGGLCVGPNTCHCPWQWSGDHCEEGNVNAIVLQLQYMHYPALTFPSLLKSILQSTLSAVCTPLCKNNGTCISPGVCNCTEEWRGNRCEIRTYVIDILLYIPLTWRRAMLCLYNTAVASISYLWSTMSKWRAVYISRRVLVQWWLDWTILWNRRYTLN